MNSTETMSSTMYDKRSGTSGIRGQLYETKLLSLINFRAIHDASIEEFCLATNIANIGAFDDICFKAKVKGFDRPVVVFIQAKHRENDKLKLDSKNDLAKYFDSYLKIRAAFKPSNEDVLFEGHFDETDCLFVMYTSARDGSNNDLVESSLAYKLNDLIGTGYSAEGTCDKAKQYYKTQEDVEFLCKIVIKEQIISLAEKMAKLIFHQSYLQMLLDDEVVLRYHVIISQKVIEVSEIQSDGYRDACFRQDFFDTNDEFLFLLKDRLYKLVIKERKLEDTEIEKLLPVFFLEPSAITTLSKLIGIVFDYKDGQLEFVYKTTTDSLKRQLSQVYVAPSTVNTAIELVAKEILSPLKFKVPAAFGNKDMTIRGNNKKIEKRLNYLTLKMCDLLNKSEVNKIVTIDESLENGLLQLNGGIASAVGNILVSDENAKLMKFTNNYESLGDLAKRLFEKLKDKINNLHEYRLDVKVKKFPKHSLDCSGQDENLARDFLNKLLFYTNQADESDVEKILKSDIEDYHRNNVNNFQAQTDAIFLTYHDKIQKWWMSPKRARHLTKESGIYKTAIKNIVKNPLVTVINIMYMNKIKNIECSFNEDAVKSLKLQDQLPRTVIVAKSIVLTVIKVMQYVKNKDHAVLDLEYILNLPTNERNALCDELSDIHKEKKPTPEVNNNRQEERTLKEKILILVFDKIQHSTNWRKILQNIAKAVYHKTIIIITNSKSVAIIKEYFTRADNVIQLLYDTRNNLMDMTDESQKSILKNGRVIFQGKEVSLDLIVDEELMTLVQGDILNKIISKEIIEVGKSISNSNYYKMKHLYVDRRVSKQGDDNYKKLETLYDIEDDVVLITALPGMGKSTLLTHLSLETKNLEPKVWIVRINLLEYSRQFNKWMENNTAIGSLETLSFMCYVILNEKHGEEEEISIPLEESNGVVYLKECTADPLISSTTEHFHFELKMFLHYYYTGKLIFLFDGFDEICPFYADDVIKCIKIVKNHHRKHKIWIASRPYSEIKSVLESDFSQSYEIKPFSYDERGKYLEQFWKTNLIIRELDSAQLDNVYEFIEFISKLRNRPVQHFESQLEEIYTYAAAYLINEVKFTHIPLWTYNINKNDGNYMQVINIIKYRQAMCEVEGVDCDGIPLNIYLIADYFQNEIKDVNKTTERWNLDINTYTIYARFIETKLNKIRFQEKNKMDIFNPDIMITLEKERADFKMKHSKLAAYAIFHHDQHAIFSRNELNEIKDTIQLLKKGKEKTGLICGTPNNIPMFIHLTFAEYFAAEHLCVLLKNENCSEKQISTLDFLLNVIFSASRYNVVKVLIDYRINMDDALLSALKEKKHVIFDLLMKQGTETKSIQWSLDIAVSESLNNFMNLFLWIYESNLNENNLDDFIDIFQRTQILRSACLVLCDSFIDRTLNIVRNTDVSKLRSLLYFDNFTPLSSETKFEAMSNDQIINLIHNEFDDRRNSSGRSSPSLSLSPSLSSSSLSITPAETGDS